MGIQVFVIILGLILCYLAVVIFSPFLSVKAEVINRNPKDKMIPKCRQSINITVDNTQISGWLYLPEDIRESVSCVILSNGFCGTKDAVLEDYALRFVDVGVAAITYDYRYFGESGGEPRQLFNGIKQMEDLRAVIEYARTQENIDADKIVLWSTSAAGRYGIILAAEDEKIAGVISQCPSLDHSKDDKLILKREGIGYFFKIFVHAQRDKGRSRLGLSAHFIPAVGKPGSFALLNAPEAFEGYQSLTSESEYFINKICGRSMLMMQGPDVTKLAQNVKCPVLILVCEKDTTVSSDSYKKVAEILGEKATVIKYPVGHFDMYSGAVFNNAVESQIDFLKRVFLLQT
ncbi:MAG: alpha/beta hydrolase [Eubacteriales bacterium]|nr:alpha/beta hydrolase [Eubacteriales bacterium]